MQPDFVTFLPIYSLSLSVLVITVICFWRIFALAGQPGWAAIIPVYNLLIWLKIIDKPWWWIIMLFIPVANIVFYIWMINLLAKSFGRSSAFTVGLIFLSIIFFPILAFNDYEYTGNLEGEPRAKSMDEIRDRYLLATIILIGLSALTWFICSLFKTWWEFKILIILQALFTLYIPVFLISVSTSKKYRVLTIVLGIVIIYLMAFSNIFPAMRQVMSGGYY